MSLWLLARSADLYFFTIEGSLMLGFDVLLFSYVVLTHFVRTV